MTNPVQAGSGPTATPTSPTASPSAPSPQSPTPASDFTVEISRASAAPVYVYRMTDTATGRVLVEIPDDPSTSAAPGAKVDAKA